MDLPPWADALDVSRVGEQEYALARAWVQRRASLSPTAATDLAVEVGEVLRQRVEGIPEGVTDDRLITVVVTLVQRRTR